MIGKPGYEIKQNINYEICLFWVIFELIFFLIEGVLGGGGGASLTSHKIRMTEPFVLKF